jgi:hypothetical protein
MQRHLCLLLVCVLFVSLALLLSGCMDIAQWQVRTFYGLDCRPEKLTPDGRCTPVKKGGTDAQAVHTPRS